MGTFAYYLPDVFFLISGFLFARKLFRMEEYKEEKEHELLKALGRKVLRLYPLYFLAIIIYWFVTPALHAGPLWVVYEQQVDQCQSAWWRALLLIDNWFPNGCYNFAWFVQVEIQLVLLMSLIFFVYVKKRTAGIILLNVVFNLAIVLMFVFSSEMPSSVESMLSEKTQLYFRSFYSHLFFYTLGALLSHFLEKESIRSFLQHYFVDNHGLFTGSVVAAFGLIILIIMRPGVWDNAL